MNDKEALQKIVYITNHYVNNTDWWKRIEKNILKN